MHEETRVHIVNALHELVRIQKDHANVIDEGAYEKFFYSLTDQLESEAHGTPEPGDTHFIWMHKPDVWAPMARVEVISPMNIAFTVVEPDGGFCTSTRGFCGWADITADNNPCINMPHLELV